MIIKYKQLTAIYSNPEKVFNLPCFQLHMDVAQQVLKIALTSNQLQPLRQQASVQSRFANAVVIFAR